MDNVLNVFSINNQITDVFILIKVNDKEYSFKLIKKLNDFTSSNKVNEIFHYIMNEQIKNCYFILSINYIKDIVLTKESQKYWIEKEQIYNINGDDFFTISALSELKFDKDIKYNSLTKKYELIPSETFIMKYKLEIPNKTTICLIYYLKKNILFNQIFLPKKYVDIPILNYDKYVIYENEYYIYNKDTNNYKIIPKYKVDTFSYTNEYVQDEIKEVNFCFFNEKIINFIKTCKYELVISMYNIENNQIIDELILAYRRGIKISLLTSYKCLESKHYNQQSSYYKLITSGISINAIIHEVDNIDDIHSSMHTKFVIKDNKEILTGSVNWENLSCTTNEEQMLHIISSRIANQYKTMYEMFLTGDNNKYLQSLKNVKKDCSIQLYETLHTKTLTMSMLYNSIENIPKGTICYLSMFIFSKFNIHENNIFDLLKKRTSLNEIILNIIVEKNTNSDTFGSYYTNKIPHNEYLVEVEKWENTKVYRIKTFKGNNNYSAIHHKFFVTNELVICGSANWWDISFTSEDDLLIIHDKPTSKLFLDAWHDLIYPTFTINKIPFDKDNLVYVEIEETKERILLTYSKLMNEYYGKLVINYNEKITNNIRYKYIILNKKEEICSDNIIRTKTFDFYIETDHWNERSFYDNLLKEIILL